MYFFFAYKKNINSFVAFNHISKNLHIKNNSTEVKKLYSYNIVEKKTYSYNEAYEASLEYFNGDELAARVWVNKYAVKDSFGNIYEKSPEDMHWRLANEVARIEANYPNSMSSQELFIHSPSG